MKKTIILLSIILTGLLSQAQVKDSVVYKPDSVDVISVTDMNTCLKYIEDKVTKKEYDSYLQAYQLLLGLVDRKRKITVKTKH